MLFELSVYFLFVVNEIFFVCLCLSMCMMLFLFISVFKKFNMFVRF